MLPLAVTIFGFTFSRTAAVIIALVVVVVVVGLVWFLRGRREGPEGQPVTRPEPT